MKNIFFVLALAISMSANAAPTVVAKPTPTSAVTAAKLDKEIIIATGSATGTYYRFAGDMKGMLSQSGIKITPQNSNGSVDNLQKLADNAEGNVSMAIVQADLLGFIKRSQNPELTNIGGKIRLIAPLYKEDVHILARSSVRTLADLNGKTIAIGAVGSGSWLTASNIFGIMKVVPQKTLRITPEEGVLAVLSGKADAMVFVGGSPVKLFTNIDSLAGHKEYQKMVASVHLLGVNDKKLLSEYSLTTIPAGTYKFMKYPVSTISVLSLLVSYDNGMANRCGYITKFYDELNGKLGQLKSFGHTKWKEVELDADVYMTTKDKCLNSPSKIKSFEEDFKKTMAN
jgi:uncharacterized protein